MKTERLAIRDYVSVRAVLLFGWALLALAAFIPSPSIPVSVQMQAAAFGVMVVALVAATISAPAQLRWGGTISTTLRVCWVLMVVSSGSFRGRIDYADFAAVFVAALACGAALGAVVRSRKARSNGHPEL